MTTEPVENGPCTCAAAFVLCKKANGREQGGYRAWFSWVK
jgi:hypothetical protein